MPLLSVGMSLSGWLPSVRFIPSKDIPTDNSGGFRTDSVDYNPTSRNVSRAVTVPVAAERHLHSGE